MTPVWAVNRPGPFLQGLKDSGWTVLASSLDTSLPSCPISSLSLTYLGPTVLVMGSEGEGIPQEVLDQASRGVFIPPAAGVQEQVTDFVTSMNFWLLHWSSSGGQFERFCSSRCPASLPPGQEMTDV